MANLCDMTQEELRERYQWTLDHEEELKDLCFEKIGPERPITNEVDRTLINLVRDDLIELYRFRKALLSYMEPLFVTVIEL